MKQKEEKLVVFLHGFPQHPIIYSDQLFHFAGLGFKVVAPAMRGYSLSEKPLSYSEYTFHLLSRDIEKLIEHYGYKSAIVVGHDWGGAVAWALALRNPSKVEKLISINMAHPKSLWQKKKKKKSMFVNFLFSPPPYM